MAKNNKGKTALNVYGKSSRVNPPLSAAVKKQRCNELKADWPWTRRWPFMSVVISSGFRPIQARRLESELNRLAHAPPAELTPLEARQLPLELGQSLSFDASVPLARSTLLASIGALFRPAPPVPVQLDTPERRRAYWMSVILRSDFLLRRIVSFL